ncbi:uncharacterized protein [Typha angustifolia]|uniref:uncharacterized protein isoform X2 n=1 Tax=Typha angustifolia TaxID=59011 RepID=UPI003C2E9C10
MRKRGERSVKDLYDRTKKISQPEAFPEESFCIQGRGDQLDHELLRMKSGTFSACSPRMRAESGTCNVCSAPCSSCLHRSLSVMELKVESAFSDNSGRVEEDGSCTLIDADEQPLCKRRKFDDEQHVSSETSNIVSANSSNDSSCENVESKVMLGTSTTCDISENVDMPSEVCEAIAGQQLLSPKNFHSDNEFCSSPREHQRFSDQDGEKHGVECHGDNISCLSGFKDASVPTSDQTVEVDKKDITCNSALTCDLDMQKVSQEKGSYGLYNYENGASRGDSRKTTACTDGSPRKKSDASALKAGLCDKSVPAESTLSKATTFPEVQYPSSNAHSNHDVRPKANFGDLQHNLVTEYHEEIFECSMDYVESSAGGQLASKSTEGRKCDMLSNTKVSKANDTRRESFSRALKIDIPCLENKDRDDSKIQSDEIIKCSSNNEQHQLKSSFLKPLSDHESQMQPGMTGDRENQEIDNELDDVKVCDICGDAGREELLATCSRCIDGAEHIYCMRVMVDKIPEGNWLCEECQLKDVEDKRKDKYETISSTPISESFTENNRNCGSRLTPQDLVKSGDTATDPEVGGFTKGKQNLQKSVKRHVDNVEVISTTSKRIVENNSGSRETASPRKSNVLSRESSFRSSHMEKIKSANIASSPRDPSVISFQASSSHAIGSMPKIQEQLHSPGGSLLKQNSFNNLNSKPRVKQLIGDVPDKKRITRDFGSTNTREGASVRKLIRSGSFKSVNSGHSNIESVKQKKLLNLPRAQSSRALKPVNEVKMLDKNNSFILDRPLVSPSAKTGSSIPKLDLKIPHHDKDFVSKSKADLVSFKRGLDSTNNLGCSEMKKTSHTSGSYERCNLEQDTRQVVPKEADSASPGATNKQRRVPDTILRNSVPQLAGLSHRGDKDKVPGNSVSTKREVPGVGQILCCNKCNEAGHAAQLCPTDNLRDSSISKSSDGQSLRGITKSSNKWKSAAAAVMSETRKRKKSILSDKSKEYSASRADVSCELVSRNLLANSNSEKNLHVNGISDQKNMSGNAEPATDVQQAKHQEESPCLPKGTTLTETSTKTLDVPNGTDSPQIDHSSLSNPFRAVVIPDHEFIWQGSFEVLRAGTLPEIYDGIQAHLSSCASPKVLEVVTQFPSRVRLEEVPRLSSWPSQFQGKKPEDDNIALYFFAKDTDSYERIYLKLLDNMLENDLALRGNINSIELLIFPSNKLQENSQRWNRLFFLWGIFRARRKGCLNGPSNSQMKICGSKLNLDSIAQDLASPDDFPCEKKNSDGNLDEKSCGNDIDGRILNAQQPQPEKSSAYVDAQPFLASGIDGRILNAINPPFHQKTVRQAPSEPVSCLFPVNKPLKSLLELHASPDTCSGLQISAEEVQTSQGAYCIDLNIVSKSEFGVAAVSPSCGLENSRQIHQNGALSAKEISPDFAQGGEGKGNIEKVREKEISMRCEEPLYRNQQENLTVRDHVSLEYKPNKKRSRSSSVETVSQASGETAKSTNENFWNRKANFIFHEDETECKKIKANSRIGNLFNSNMDRWQHTDDVHSAVVMPKNIEGANRNFFPAGLCCPAKSTIFDNAIHVPSSDDEEALESKTPDLELALGVKKSSEKEVLPLLFPLVNKKESHLEMVAPAKSDRDDLSVSLSLSLGLPGIEKEKANSVLKTEQFLPERPCLNTSLLLFRDFTNA